MNSKMILLETSEEFYTIFLNTIEKVLDEMAPISRLSKKEINLLKRPWITSPRGIETGHIAFLLKKMTRIQKMNVSK